MHYLSQPLTFSEETARQFLYQDIKEYIVARLWHSRCTIIPMARVKIDESAYYKVSDNIGKMGIVGGDIAGQVYNRSLLEALQRMQKLSLEWLQ